ncbi:heme peroxidase [Heliocybe sulcata]|uniref:Heme peroxidase n=1 Tax=Heliocybe sulcata TaxID=5364 RepID=A0A5C3MSV0_9AGAM|nr:heme peroxidase [Heliocybe sulcata]
MSPTELDSPNGGAARGPVNSAAQSRLQSITASVVRPIRNALGYREMKSPEPPKQIDPTKGTYRAFDKLAQERETDDRDSNHVFFAGLRTMSDLPDDSPMRLKYNSTFIRLINNVHQSRGAPRTLYPNSRQLGHSRPYVQTVADRNPAPQLPAISQVFDDLLRARVATAHQSSVSGLTFAFSTLISLCLYRTDSQDEQCNETSPYLDLSPLYGNSPQQEEHVRQMDGHGMLSPDCFFEDRLMFVTPVVQALLILWNRNHNYIAGRLLSNNQHNRWIDPSSVAPFDDGTLPPRLISQDNEIFDKARTINCAIFKNVVIEDFLKGIVGVPSVGSNLSLDLLGDVAGTTSRTDVVEHKSCLEFSLLYNWYTFASQDDIAWMQSALQTNFVGKPVDEITLEDYKNAFDNYRHETDLNRRRRELAGLPRGDNGFVDDNDLAGILQNATRSVAGAPRAQGVPNCMRILELATMQQARDWNVCSFNQFRRSLGLRRSFYLPISWSALLTKKTALANFEEWSRSGDAAAAAQRLYGNIENLELYVGLQAEDAPPGEGFALGYTMIFGLLVDLVSALRGDPHLSKYTREHLTDWGYDECMTKSSIGAFGAVLPKVLMRNLPHNYPYDNTYALFPFISQDLLDKCPNHSQLTEHYRRDRPSLTKILRTQEAIKVVLNDPSHYLTPYRQNLQTVLGGYGFLLGFDSESIHDADLRMDLHALLPDRATLSVYSQYFAKTAGKIIDGLKTSDSVDIVEDVIAATCAKWICDTMYGNPARKEPSTEEVFRLLCGLYAFVFDLNDPEQAWSARRKAIGDSKTLISHIERQLKMTLGSSEETLAERVRRIWAEIRGEFEVGKLSTVPFLTRLAMKHTDTLGKFGNWSDMQSAFEAQNIGLFHDKSRQDTSRPRSVREQERRADKMKMFREDFQKIRITANILGLCIMSVPLVEVCAHAVAFYLQDARSVERGEIDRLSRQQVTDKAKIMGYIRESQRLRQPPGLFRVVHGAGPDGITITQGGGQPDLKVYDGDVVFANFAMAFTNPDDTTINPSRQTPAVQGLGFHACPGIKLVEEVLPELFKSIFRMEGLRIVDGQVTAGGPKTPARAPSGIPSRKSQAPLSLRVNFTGVYKPEPRWKEPENLLKSSKRWQVILRRIKKWAIALCALVFFVCLLALLIRGFPAIQLPSMPHVHMPSMHIPSLHIPTFFSSPPKNMACTSWTASDPWHVEAIKAGQDGKPVPIEYTYRSRRPHRLSVVDADKRDLRMQLFVDGESKGLTTAFDLDKTLDCGTDLAKCLNNRFSAGVLEVPPGKHKVRIEWAGEEFIRGTEHIDWGGEKIRRFQMQREDCNP